MATGTRIPTMRDWTFGRRLAEARNIAGITQDQMAERLAEHGIHVRHAAVNRWEHDTAQPRNLFALVRAWSEITEVDEGWLLRGEGFEMRGSSTLRNRNGRRAAGPGNTHPGGGRSSDFAGPMYADEAA